MSDNILQETEGKPNKNNSVTADILGELDEVKDLVQEVDTLKSQKISLPDLQREVIDLQQELKSTKEQLLYALAESENVRFRAKQDIEKAHRYGLEKFAKDLLPVIDTLEKALVSTPDQTENPCVAGLQLTLQMLLKTLEKFGIKPMDPQNQLFDPKYHEALSTQENLGVTPNTVLSVLQKGYLLNDRLIRPALVIVSKH